MSKFKSIVNFIREQYKTDDFIPLHAPVFRGNEKRYLNECIDSTFVSSVGKFVDRFEEMMCQFTGARYAVACVNGTNALHVGLLVNGVEKDDEVITQALTFIATANAISYANATPVFVDVDKDTMGLSPAALNNFLNKYGEISNHGYTYNKSTGKRIKACVPMHTFGFPCRIDEIADICKIWNISLVEDAAESIGSFYKEKHTGLFGDVGIFSFNGNKTITSGGGGSIITNNEGLAKRAKHLTTQAKLPHQWKFVHDEIGYNYRMPNINAALACAQLEQLDNMLKSKRDLAEAYKAFFAQENIKFVTEQSNAKANYWLNTLILEDEAERDAFLEYSNQQNVMTRPIWDLMTSLSMFKDCQYDGLENSQWLYERAVNIPSGVS